MHMNESKCDAEEREKWPRREKEKDKAIGRGTWQFGDEATNNRGRGAHVRRRDRWHCFCLCVFVDLKLEAYTLG